MKQALAANRWLRAQLAIFILAVLYLSVGIWLVPTWLALWPVLLYAVAGGACWVPAHRRDEALEAARVKAATEARELRTPRAPDAGPDQCPVCGMYGLNEIAADDAFMDRGDRARVVPWGRRRAHRDCAEFVPYVAPPHVKLQEIDGHRIYCACEEHADAFTRSGAYRRCKFCGFYRRAESVEAAKEELAAHLKECPDRPRPEPVTTGRLRASIDAESIAALFTQANDRPQHMSSTGSGWMRPTLKGWRR